MPDRDDTTGINIRAVLWTGAAIIIMVALAALAAWIGWHFWLPKSDRDAPNAAMNFKIDGAELESSPQPDRAAYMAEKERLLHSYQWVDQKAGIARIPIDQAMRLMAPQATTAPVPAEGH